MSWISNMQLKRTGLDRLKKTTVVLHARESRNTSLKLLRAVKMHHNGTRLDRLRKDYATSITRSKHAHFTWVRENTFLKLLREVRRSIIEPHIHVRNLRSGPKGWASRRYTGKHSRAVVFPREHSYVEIVRNRRKWISNPGTIRASLPATLHNGSP